jgi:type I restriction enzyme, S subunit
MSTSWATSRLADLAASHKGAMAGGPFGSDLVSADYVDEGVPVIRGTNLPFDQKVSFDNLVFVTEAKADALHLNCASAGDLVFTQRGTLGQVGILPKHPIYSRYLISQSQMKMTVDKAKADPLYLYYYFRMQSSIAYIENHALQSGVPHINLAILRKLEVICPPLAVQQKIAAILTSYDDLIANNHRRIALLESMAEEIYREWFVRMRFPGYADTKKIAGLPVGWSSEPLGNLVADIRKSVKKAELATYNRYVGLEHISRKSIALTMHGEPDSVDSDKLAFVQGDILFSKIRPYLHKIALAHFNGICSTDTIVLRAKKDWLRGFVLFTVFSETFVELANTASKGTKMPRADWHYLKQLRISVPPQALLEAFTQLVRPMLDELTTLILANELLTAQAQMLLPRLISGKLRINHLDIQFPPSMRVEQAQAA